MKKSALVIAAMLAAGFMLPAQAPDPLGFPDALSITSAGQEGWNPGLSQEPQRHDRGRAPSRHHAKRNHHHRQHGPRPHAGG
jgi:hypothetical protein